MSSPRINGALAIQRTVKIRAAPPSRSSSSELARQQALEQKLAALQRDYAEIHNELIEAARVHRRLSAPRLVRHDEFEIASEIFAVRHVSGDFFAIEESSGSVVLALADISGKGLAAGMWTTHLAGLLGAQVAVNTRPEAVVAGMNRDLCRLSSVAPLASLFLARLDSETGRLDYCNAGHPPALLLRANGRLEMLSDGGLLLGVLPDAAFVSGVVDLRGGDILLICSDGVLESLNNADEEFGYERLEARLRRASGNTAETVLFSVLGAVQDFAGVHPLVDDLSMVVVCRRATKGTE